MRHLFAILLLASSAQAEEVRATVDQGTIYYTPRVPSEDEKSNALKLGYILNGFSMSRAFGEGSIDVSIYQRPLVLPSTIPPQLKPDEAGPDEVWPPPPAQVKPPRRR
jgi:hypothetical protein